MCCRVYGTKKVCVVYLLPFFEDSQIFKFLHSTLDCGSKKDKKIMKRENKTTQSTFTKIFCMNEFQNRKAALCMHGHGG